MPACSTSFRNRFTASEIDSCSRNRSLTTKSSFSGNVSILVACVDHPRESSHTVAGEPGPQRRRLPKIGPTAGKSGCGPDGCGRIDKGAALLHLDPQNTRFRPQCKRLAAPRRGKRQRFLDGPAGETVCGRAKEFFGFFGALKKGGAAPPQSPARTTGMTCGMTWPLDDRTARSRRRTPSSRVHFCRARKRSLGLEVLGLFRQLILVILGWRGKIEMSTARALPPRARGSHSRVVAAAARYLPND